MSNEEVAPETNGVAWRSLQRLPLPRRSRAWTAPPSNAVGDHRARGRLRPDSRPPRQTRHRLRRAGNDHRPSKRGRDGLWAGSGLARGSEHDPLAGEPGNDSCGGDLVDIVRARVKSRHCCRACDQRERELSDVKIGALCWNQYTDWPSLLEAGIRADRLGYSSLWTWDHLYPIVGDPHGPNYEGGSPSRPGLC